MLEALPYDGGLVIGFLAGAVGVLVYLDRESTLKPVVDEIDKYFLVVAGVAVSILGFLIDSITMASFGVVFTFTALIAHYTTKWRKNGYLMGVFD